MLEHAPDVYASGVEKRQGEPDLKVLHAKIDPVHGLPVKRQAQILQLARSSVCSRPAPASESDLALGRAASEASVCGFPVLRDILRRDVHEAGRKRITGLMRNMEKFPSRDAVTIV